MLQQISTERSTDARADTRPIALSRSSLLPLLLFLWSRVKLARHRLRASPRSRLRRRLQRRHRLPHVLHARLRQRLRQLARLRIDRRRLRRVSSRPRRLALQQLAQRRFARPVPLLSRRELLQLTVDARALEPDALQRARLRPVRLHERPRATKHPSIASRAAVRRGASTMRRSR